MCLRLSACVCVSPTDQFTRGDYVIATPNPHLPASVLKFWLRDMLEPLIPCALYHECIEMGKVSLTDAKPTPTMLSSLPPKPLSSQPVSLAPSQLPQPAASLARPIPLASAAHRLSSQELSARLSQLLSNVPPVNRRVMARVVALLQLIAQHKDVNKMSISNLAIVFAPSFLRDPSDDPLVRVVCGFAASPHLTSPSPHLTSPHLASPCLTSPHLTSPHLASSHLTSPHLASPHLTSSHLTSSHLIPVVAS